MMILAANGGALGGHLAGWRHRDAYATATMQLDVMISSAKIAEAGGLDVIFLADGNGVRQMDKPALFAATSPGDRMPISTAAWRSMAAIRTSSRSCPA